MERIERAFTGGDIDAAQRERYRTFAKGTQEGREGRIGVFIGRSVLDHDWRGCNKPLLPMWGGEALYAGMESEWPKLRKIGSPAIVVAAVDLSSDADILGMSRCLAEVFVGTEIDVREVGASFNHTAPILGADVIDIWQPGNPEYDRHEKLPR
jgi:hypothetical protein